MIDIKHILSSPNRDDEIRKLIVVEHEFKAGICRKCGCLYGQSGSQSSCPDPIVLDWNLAMEKFREAMASVDTKRFRRAAYLERVYFAGHPEAKSMPRDWFIFYAKPTDIILAAILAGEGE